MLDPLLSLSDLAIIDFHLVLFIEKVIRVR
jgi:hypothetical protein